MQIILGILKSGLFAAATGLALVSLVGEFGRFFPTLDTVNHFRPFTMIAAIFLLAGIMLVHRRPLRARPVFWLTLATLGIQGISLGPEVTRAILTRAAASPLVDRQSVLRIVTLNVWGRNSRPREAADALLALAPDVIVLQEAWRGQEPLVTMLKKTHPHTSDCVAMSLCNVAILSRFPFRDIQVLPPEAGKAGKWTVPVARADLDPAAADLPFEASIFTTHLTWPNQVPLQKRQMQQLAGVVRTADRSRVVLLGDFNSTPWSYGLAYLGELLDMERVTLALPTWPSGLVPRRLRVFRSGLAAYGLKPSPLYAPFLPIDHAFVGDGLEARSVQRAGIPGSDHYAVVIDIARKSDTARR